MPVNLVICGFKMFRFPDAESNHIGETVAKSKTVIAVNKNFEKNDVKYLVKILRRAQTTRTMVT
jgi:hypothetical protein